MNEEEVGLLRERAGEPALLVRRQARAGAPVLYVHGATFPSALSVAYRFAGRSWMDDLAEAGFDAWAFDFAGFGGSERPPDMALPPEGLPIGRAPDAAAQIARVAEHISEKTGHTRVSIIAHSWGTMPAALHAAKFSGRIERLCLFAPVARRNISSIPLISAFARWRLVTVAEQLLRFIEDVPSGRAPVLLEPDLAAWGGAYLATDPEARLREPPSVKIPSGPAADVAAAWAGTLAWQPEEIKCPTLIVRGEWDTVSSDRDAQWLAGRMANARIATIAEGTHLLHLEKNREKLFAAVREFLGGAV